MIQKKIILDYETKIDLIDIEKIVYVTIDSTNTVIHLITGSKYSTNKTLTFFENYAPDIFFKINRNTIVNLSYIISINKLTRKIIIEDDIVLCVSSRQLRLLAKHLKPILIRSKGNN